MVKEKKVEVLLHNIRSAHNIGSIFRTADSLGVDKIWLSGFSPTPLDRFGRARKDLAKVALGAEKSVEWESVEDPRSLIKKLKKINYEIVGIEQSENSVDYKKVKIKKDALFVVGSEVEGIESDILKMCDVVAEIPMSGEKESLNVSVAFGIAMYRMLGI